MLAPKQIYILLINAGTDNEGIHSLQVGDRNKILMFETEDDATRYALMLEAQDFPVPTVEGFPFEEIEEFCQEAGYEWELVESGQLELPPEANVKRTDWELEQEKNAEASPFAPPSESEEEIPSEQLDAIRRQLEGLL
ncbi:DUF3110 domain-containing protein [Spirulina subsalsa]|uniref:DUF3110 domain-containing protein n=1 Tax=Spirulina subsalsa TaxID=54311 RepID=UPI000311928F|nr:DUF3110 domain-containing protein [Spirulina subsalsa]